MQCQHSTNSTIGIALIAARQVPNNRYAVCCASTKNKLIAHDHLLCGQQSTERIVNMNVCSCLI